MYHEMMVSDLQERQRIALHVWMTRPLLPIVIIHPWIQLKTADLGTFALSRLIMSSPL